MNKLRRFLTIGVMAITVLTTGFSAVSVKASASAGDLIKMDGLSSVYYLGDDGKRYVFPNEATFFSWYSDFSSVVTISASELQSYPIGGNVTLRPGTKLVKITTDPSVYAVEPNGVLRKIQSEAQAIALYGTNWNKRVVDIADAFFSNYTIGSALTSGSIPAGSLVKNEGAADVYYYDGSAYRKIASESAFNANRFQFSNVLTVSNAITAAGSSIASAELVNVAQNGKTTGPVVTGSGLAISLSSATPASASVPKNGTRVPFAKVNLTAASDGGVTVNSITVKRIGLSAYDDIDKVWLEKDGTTIASKKTVNSNDEATLVFSPALNINAGQTVSIELVASLKAAGGNIGFSVASASAVNATAASVTGSFPVSGNLMSPTDYTVAEVVVDQGDTSKTVNVGDEDIRLGKFNVNFATGTKDIVLKSISLKNTGNEDLADVVSNVYLENNGTEVATGVIDGKYIIFTFANGGEKMAKDDGDQTFYIKGDIIGKEVAGTATGIALELNKDTDMVGVEASTGFGIKVTSSTAGTFSAVSTASLVINSGAIAVSKKSTSPSDSTIIKNTKGVVALLANVKADEAITADGMRLNVVQTSSTSFENVKVYLNGALVDSFDPTAVATTSLDSSISLNKGDNEIKVTVDIKSNAGDNAKFQVSLNQASSLLDTAEYVTSGNSVSSSDVTGSATGAIITVGGASLSAAKSDGYATSKTVVIGSTDVSLGKFTVKATNDTIKITQIKVASTSGNTVSAANVYDFKLFIDGNQVGTTKDFTSTGATFSSLNISVADNATKMIELKGSFDNSATGTLKTTLEFTAEDSNGKTVTVSEKPSTSSFAVTDKGTLTIAKDGDSATSAILSSKAGIEQAVATYKLTATNDSATLTELIIVSASSTGTGTSTITATDPRIASYKLYVEGNTSAIDTVTPFNGQAKFVLNSNQVVVPVDGSKKLTVKAVLNNIDNDATATDAYLKVQVNSMKFKSSNGTETSSENLYVAGNEFRIRKTVPTIALVALPNTTLTSGIQTVSKFTIAADSNADVRVAKLAIKYASSSNVDLANGSVKINGVTKTGTSAAVNANKYIIVNFGTSTPEIISAGTSKTFEITSNVTVGGTTSRESLSTSIKENDYGIVAASTYATTDAFIWSDSASNTDASNIWFNGWRVNGLPSDTQTMSAN